MKVNNFRLTNIGYWFTIYLYQYTNIVTLSENESAVVEREVGLELEKKIYSITKGASSSAYFNYFKNMASTNIQNVNILYDFITTEQNYINVKLSTRISYIKVICLFNRYLSYKNFFWDNKNGILNYLNSKKNPRIMRVCIMNTLSSQWFNYKYWYQDSKLWLDLYTNIIIL